MSASELSVHGNGGSLSEVFAVVLVPVIGLILRNLFLPWITQGSYYDTHGKRYWYKGAADFAFIVLPIIMSQTVLADQLVAVHSTLLAMLLLVLIFMAAEYSMVAPREAITPFRQLMNRTIEEHHSPTMFLTYFRSLIFLLVCVAILAVDFSIFPRRFAKTEKYGYSLMDVGVAAFVIASGLVHPLKTAARRESAAKRNSGVRFGWIYSSTFVMVTIGLVRTFLLWLLGYPYEVNEYGVHWNFFYTLAAVELATHILPGQFTVVTATTFAVGHQIALSYGVQEWVLNESAPRINFVEANREGICSIAGYIALYYYARAVGRLLARTGFRLRSWAMRIQHLGCISLLFNGLAWMAETGLGPPSRRLVNLPYILSMSSLATFLLCACMAAQVMTYIIWAARFPHFGAEENPFATSEPCLLTSINSHALAFFLISNVGTGVINMCIRHIGGYSSTLLLGEWASLLLLVIYCSLCCSIVHAMPRIRILGFSF